MLRRGDGRHARNEGARRPAAVACAARRNARHAATDAGPCRPARHAELRKGANVSTDRARQSAGRAIAEARRIRVRAMPRVDRERCASVRHAKSAQKRRGQALDERRDVRVAFAHFRIDPVRDPAREAKAARGDRERRQQRVIEAAQPDADHEEHGQPEARRDVEHVGAARRAGPAPRRRLRRRSRPPSRRAAHRPRRCGRGRSSRRRPGRRARGRSAARTQTG